MLSEFRSKKIGYLFDAYDADKNGYIDRNDYLRFADNLAATGALQPGSKELERMKSETMALWNQIREHADTNRDERVTREEWLKWQTSLDDASRTSGGSFPLEKYIGVLCDLMDSDQDGKISAKEYENVVRAYGYQNVDVPGNFKTFDADGDGFLSRAEVIKVSAEFWLSEDPAAPANYIYGKF